MSKDPRISDKQFPIPADDYAYILTLSDAELAWEFLRRNPDYRNAFDALGRPSETLERRETGLNVWHSTGKDEPATAWGLTTFH